MKEFEFTLVVAGDLEDGATMDVLFEAGCDDATFGTVDGVGYADFARLAPSFATAVRSAIDNIESVGGLQVQRVEPDDLVTMNEIAQRMERTRESVRLLIQGARGPGGFPPPASHLKARSRLWRWSEVAEWAKEQGIEVPPHSGPFVAAINAALALRACRVRLTPKEHELVASIVQAA